MSRISGNPTLRTEHVYGLTLRVARWREGAPGMPLLFLNGIGADIGAAAPLLAQQERGLIAFTSSPGAVCYMHGPAYGAQKAGVDKMAADMAVDFHGTGVSTLSIWMGILLTDKFKEAFDPEMLVKAAGNFETPEFTGHVINALFDDPNLADISGQTLIAAEEAQRYGITDVEGRTPPSHRAMLGDPRVPSDVVVR